MGVVTLFAMGNKVTTVSRATEEIAYLSQKIANDYLYLYHNPEQKMTYQNELRIDVRKIENDIRFIAINTKNEDIKNILDFLSYDKDKIKALAEEEISRENAVSILDESNALVEGLQSIIKTTGRKSLKSMIRFHIMKLSKLYMAIHLKFDPTENTKVFYTEIQDIDTMMKYRTKNIKQLWRSYKEILNPSPIYFLPNIVAIIISDLEQKVGHI